MDIAKIGQVCGQECERQGVDLDGLFDLLNAYRFLWLYRNPDGSPVTHDTVHLPIRLLGYKVDGHRGYRRNSVTFEDGGSAASWQDVEPAMERLLDNYEHGVTDVDEFVRAFLSIHPFKDGNGRVAFLLHNWLSGTLDSPHPLPHYFGEGN